MLNAGARRPLQPAEAASFSGAPRWTVLDGPRRIYRLLGTWRDSRTGKKGRSNPRGAFWCSGAVLGLLREEYLDHMEFELSGLRPRPGSVMPLGLIRDGLAVSQEWNSFDSLMEMTIPHGSGLGVWSGVTQWQLAQQARPQGPRLSGGFEQYVVPGVERLPEALFRRQPLHSVWAGLSRDLGRFG